MEKYILVPAKVADEPKPIPAQPKISGQELRYKHARNAPIYATLDELDSEMQNLLADRLLPPDQKISAYYSTLSRYSDLRGSRQALGPAIPAIGIPDVVPGKAGYTDREILANIPPSKQENAKLLLDEISKNPDITVNDRNELVIRGGVVPNSNYMDLVVDLSRDRKYANPTGLGDLIANLQNVPQNAIGNIHRKRIMFPSPGSSNPTPTQLGSPRISPLSLFHSAGSGGVLSPATFRTNKRRTTASNVQLASPKGTWAGLK
jgi:hypothetical protein